MTNPRPSASTFAIDGGAGEPVERVSLAATAMDPPRQRSPWIAAVTRVTAARIACTPTTPCAEKKIRKTAVTRYRRGSLLSHCESPAAFHVFTRPSVSGYHGGGGSRREREEWSTALARTPRRPIRAQRDGAACRASARRHGRTPISPGRSSPPIAEP